MPTGVDLQEAKYSQEAPAIDSALLKKNQIFSEVERGLAVIDELEAAVEANLTRADRLRQSILQRAFVGQLPS